MAAVASGASVATSVSSDSDGSSGSDRKRPTNKKKKKKKRRRRGVGGGGDFNEYVEERGLSHLNRRDRIALICKARIQSGEREKVNLGINQIDYFQCKFCGIIRKP